jgi:hypothetical protein
VRGAIVGPISRIESVDALYRGQRGHFPALGPLFGSPVVANEYQ